MRLANTHRDGEVLKTALERSASSLARARHGSGARCCRRSASTSRGWPKQAPRRASSIIRATAPRIVPAAPISVPTAAPITHVAQLPLMGVRLRAHHGGAWRSGTDELRGVRRLPQRAAAARHQSVGFKGLARIPSWRGLLVAYAAEPGNVAIDQNLYSTALAEEIVKPGLEAGQVFRAVARRVLSATQNRQTPEYLDKRLYDFHFAAAVKPEVRPTPAPTRPTAPVRPKTQVGTSQFMDDPLHEAQANLRVRIHRIRPSTQSTFMMDWDALVLHHQG